MASAITPEPTVAMVRRLAAWLASITTTSSGFDGVDDRPRQVWGDLSAP